MAELQEVKTRLGPDDVAELEAAALVAAVGALLVVR